MKKLILFLALFTPFSWAQNNLATSLNLIPGNATGFAFSDWDLILDDLNAGRSQLFTNDARDRFFRAVLENHAVPTQSVNYAYTNKSNWAWDSIDLSWELDLWGLGEGASILKFHDHFDFSKLKNIFAELEFSVQTYKGISIYRHDDIEVLTNGPIGTGNTAILEAQKLMVLSTSFELGKQLIDTILGTGASAKDNAALLSLVSSWENPMVAIVDYGPEACRDNTAENMLGSNDQALETYERMQETYDLATLNPYESISFAYTAKRENFKKDYIASFSLGFTNASLAKSDSALREMLITDGFSLIVDQPIKDILFDLEETVLKENTLSFQGKPSLDLRRLLQMIYARDLLFAVCP